MSTLSKESSVKISKLHFDGILIPEILINKGQHYRIELGISHNSKRDLLMNILEEECIIQHVTTLKRIKGNNKIKNLVFSKTVENFFSENNVSEVEVEDIIRIYNSNSFNKIRRETKLKNLSEQEIRLFKIFILIQSHKKIFIDTCGMHLSVFIMTYELVRDFLKSGGIVIELAYPHFENGSEFESFTTKNMKTIQIGEMRISQ